MRLTPYTITTPSFVIKECVTLNFMKPQVKITKEIWDRLPKEILVLDIETFNTNFKNHADTRIKIIGVKLFLKKSENYEDTGYKYFKENQIEEFTSYLNLNPSAKILGHNTKSFDFRVLSHYLSPTVSWRLEVDNIDTLLCLRFIFFGFPKYKGELSLDSLGMENFGHGKVKIKSSIVDLTNSDYTTELLKYNERDLDLTFMIWYKMISEFTINIKGTGSVNIAKPFKSLKSGNQLEVSVSNLERSKEKVMKVLTGEVVIEYDNKSISWQNYDYLKTFSLAYRGEMIKYKVIASSNQRFRLEVSSTRGSNKIKRCKKFRNRWRLESELYFYTEEENHWRLVDTSRKKVKGDILVKLELCDEYPDYKPKYEYFPKVHTQYGSGIVNLNLNVFKSYIHK